MLQCYNSNLSSIQKQSGTPRGRQSIGSSYCSESLRIILQLSTQCVMSKHDEQKDSHCDGFIIYVVAPIQSVRDPYYPI